MHSGTGRVYADAPQDADGFTEDSRPVCTEPLNGQGETPMGFYLRKSVSVGPLRFNLSKAGIGVSAGVRGFRVGAGPRGNYVHMGRHGLYYRATLPSAGGSHPERMSTPPTPSAPFPVDALTPIDSGSVAAMVDSSSADLLREINDKLKRHQVWPWVFGLSLLGAVVSAYAFPPGSPLGTALGVSALLIGTIGGGLAYRRDVLAKTIVLLYDIEEEAAQRYDTLHRAFDQITSCGGRWHVQAKGRTRDPKYEAGAGHVLRRSAITVAKNPPRWVQTNIAVPSIPAGRETLYFFPDRLLVFSPDGAGAVSYDALSIDVHAQRFIESERVPADAQVVGQTWQYVNKNGGPDRRFKGNRQIPIALYEELHFQSPTGLNEVIQLSRIGVGQAFREAVTSLAPAEQPKV